MISLKRIASIWGIAGVLLLLGFAVYRLVPFAGGIFDHELSWWQWIIVVIWSVFMIYSEGVRAFQKQFSPRVVARAQYLLRAKKLTAMQIVLAPLFCIGYFDAAKRRVTTAYGLAAGIILLIILVHFVPQPWRGIIDSGVVLGLVYGIGTVLVWTNIAIEYRGRYVADPEVIIKRR